MPRYCLSRKPLSNGDYDVHNVDSDCPYLPDVLHQIDLGEHDTCASAVEAAQALNPNANGCYNCATGCHVDRDAQRPWVRQAPRRAGYFASDQR
ncbi:MAG: hypothetical protein AAGC53_18000 [Actinomycetota bacterium]